MNHRITIVPSTAVNVQQWDDKIHTAPEGLIYATTKYLNTIAQNWDALIVNDYEAIMPIPWKKKAGIKYAYTPAFTQQLGFIGNTENLPHQQIIKRIQSYFRYGSILLNFNNSLLAEPLTVDKKLNCTLSLQHPAETLISNFKDNHLQTINKALKQNMLYTKAVPTEQSILIYKELHGHKMKQVKDADYQKFSTYCIQHLTINCFTRSVLSKTGELLATAIILNDGKRLYNIINCTTPEGKSSKANHYLFYCLIQEFAGQDLLLDFEGSSIPGVKAFYQSFGAQEEWYYIWHYNNLPFPLSLMP